MIFGLFCGSLQDIIGDEECMGSWFGLGAVGVTVGCLLLLKKRMRMDWREKALAFGEVDSEAFTQCVLVQSCVKVKPPTAEKVLKSKC